MNIKNMKSQGLKALESLQDLDRDDLLEALSLQERHPTGAAAGALGIFFLGALVGLGFGLAFAPKAGAELRNELGETVRRKASELGPLDEKSPSPGMARPHSSLT